MGGNYTHTTRATGTVLTASIYNADHQNHIDNQTPAGTDDYSANVTEMRLSTDPGESGSESLATSLAGELERLRFAIKEIKGTTHWYETPAFDLTAGFPSGVMVPYGGITLPSAGWLWADGSAVSRATYAALFALCVKSATVTATSGTDVINWTAHGLKDWMPVKFSNSGGTIPAPIVAGRTYWIRDQSTNSFKIALVPGGAAIDITTDGTGTTTAVVAPWGDGDGSTTFNLPNPLGRLMSGWGTTTVAEAVDASAVDTGTDVITVLDNNAKLITGMAVVLTTSGGAPGGLTAGNTYYVIRASISTIKLASTLANAQAGTAINLTSTGTGTHTFTYTIRTKGLGEVWGEDTHAQASAEVGPHTHDFTMTDTSGGATGAMRGLNAIGTNATAANTAGAAMNIWPPTFGVGYIIKT